MKYRADIDGLRAVAVLPVVFYHAGFPGFAGGYVGVDVFFVISGYLISSIIITELAAGTFSLRRFYERRARRILPALFLVTVACIPFAWMWMPLDGLREFSRSVAAVALFSSNFLFWREAGYFAAPNEFKPLIHTWSLAVEEQFYILFPLFLLCAWRLQRKWWPVLLAGVAILSLGFAVWAGRHEQAANFYLLPSRAWELAVGALLAVREHRHGQFSRHRLSEFAALTGLALILVSVVTFGEDTRHPGVVTVVPVLGTALLIRFAGSDRFVSRGLAAPPLLGIGLLSYSLYLWHQPLFAFARIWSISDPAPSHYLALIVVAVLLSAISWRWVERPFRNRAVVSTPRVWAAAAFGLLLLVGIGMYGTLAKAALNRFPEDTALSARPRSGRADPSGIGRQPRSVTSGNCRQGFDTTCVLGDAQVAPTFALVGDSHANRVHYSIASTLKKRRQSSLFLWQAGCPYAPGLKRTDGRYDCVTWANAVRERLGRGDINTVFLSGRYVNLLESTRFDNGEGGVEKGERAGYVPVEAGPWDRDDAARRAAVAEHYRGSVAELLELGLRVVLIYPVPEAGWNVPDTLFKLRRRASPVPLTTSHQAYLARSRETLAAFDSIGEHPNLVRVRPDRLFCNTLYAGRCSVNSGKDVYYEDNNHLARPGARMVVRAAFNAMDDQLGAAADTVPE